MPPLATFSTPLSVIVPDVVIGEPLAMRPVEPVENPTLVTPPLAVEAIVMLPELLVMVMPVPAVRVLSAYPAPVPMSTCPLVGAVATPVPPALNGSVPLVSTELLVA